MERAKDHLSRLSCHLDLPLPNRNHTLPIDGRCKLLPLPAPVSVAPFRGLIIVHHLRIDQRCNPVPQVGVVLDLMMGLIERTYKPWIVVAID